jgi:hypothetical protein
MVVERSFGHIGGSQNHVDACALESSPVDLLKTCFQQAFPRAFRIAGVSLFWIS